MRKRTMAIIRRKRDRKVEMSENDYDESDVVVVVHQFLIFSSPDFVILPIA